jgi:hypothetical protein
MGIDVGADVDSELSARRAAPGWACIWGPAGGGHAFRRRVGEPERAIGALIGVMRSRGSVAGIEPVGGIGRIVGPGFLGHDVSILPGAGCHRGSQPRANVSMTIMRPPQHGHGQVSMPEQKLHQKAGARMRHGLPWARHKWPWLARKSGVLGGAERSSPEAA